VRGEINYWWKANKGQVRQGGSDGVELCCNGEGGLILLVVAVTKVKAGVKDLIQTELSTTSRCHNQ